MSDHVVPHFHNDAGVAVIEIGSREFMTIIDGIVRTQRSRNTPPAGKVPVIVHS